MANRIRGVLVRTTVTFMLTVFFHYRLLDIGAI